MNEQAFKLLTKKIEELSTDIKDVKGQVDIIRTDLGHYKGFIAGVVFVFSSAWAFIWSTIKSKFGAHS